MTSGAKKRKAAKKKMQEETHESTHPTTGSHHQDDEEEKSFEERIGDGTEIERDEEEEKEVVEEAGVEEAAKELGLDEETAVEKIVQEVENVLETLVNEVRPEIASITDVDDDDDDDDSVIKESLNVDPLSENGKSNDIILEGNEDVVGEEEETVVEEISELNWLDDNQLPESSFGNEAGKQQENLPEEEMVVPPSASTEEALELIEDKAVDGSSVMQFVPPVEEVSLVMQNASVEILSVTVVGEPEPNESGIEVVEWPAEEDELPSIMPDILQEETKSEVAPIVVEDIASSSTSTGLRESANRGKIAEPSAFDANAVVDEVKVLEIYEPSEDKIAAPIPDTTNVVHFVDELKTNEISEVKVDAPVVDTSLKTEDAADLINESEQNGFAATDMNRKESNVKETQKIRVSDDSEAQEVISSTPRTVQRAFWSNCCGLFDLFVRPES